MGGLWEDMKGAKIQERGKPPLAGRFDLVVSRALVKDTFGYGTAFIIEFEVFNTTNPDQPEGSSCNLFQKIDGPQKQRAAAMSYLKSTIVALLGYDFPKDKDRIEREFEPICDRFMEAATSDANPLSGLFVHCESYPVRLEAKGDKPARDVTNQRYYPFDYEGQGVDRPDVHALLRMAETHAGGQVRSPAMGAPPPPPPIGGRTFPPGTVFHPAGTWPGGGATHYFAPGMSKYESI